MSDDSLMWHAKKRLAELDLLEAGEIPVEEESVGLEHEPGLLLATDRRVLYVRAAVFTDKTHVVSIPFGEIDALEASERRAPFRKRGSIAISTGEETYLFEYIRGGLTRAQEIVGSIARQRDLLSGRSQPTPRNG